MTIVTNDNAFFFFFQADRFKMKIEMIIKMMIEMMIDMILY